MKTVESNKLIALFAGDIHTERLQNAIKNDVTYGGGKNDFHFNEKPVLETLKYHSSWDWLMPVVQKIKDWCFVNQQSGDIGMNWYQHINTNLLLLDIDNVWRFTVKFIQWYNKNK